MSIKKIIFVSESLENNRRATEVCAFIATRGKYFSIVGSCCTDRKEEATKMTDMKRDWLTGYIEKQMKDPEFKKAWEESELEYKVLNEKISKMIETDN